MLGPVKGGAGRGRFQVEGTVRAKALGTLCMFEGWRPVWRHCRGRAGEWNGVRPAVLARGGEMFGSLESHGKPLQCLAHSRCLVELAALTAAPPYEESQKVRFACSRMLWSCCLATCLLSGAPTCSL